MDVTVYTQPACRSCKRVIETLEGEGISVEVIDISDPDYEEARTYVMGVLGALSVPVIVSDVMPVIYGYEPRLVAQLINKLKEDR